MRFYFEQNDNRFCLNVSNLVLLRQTVFLQNLFSAIGALIFILLLSHFLSPKLKRRRLKKRKEERKLRRKRGRTSFDFFQLLLSLFSIKRNSKGKETRKNRSPFLSHSLSSTRKNREKKREKGEKTEEKKQKEIEVGIKRRAFHFSLILSSCSHSFPKNEKDTEKIEK